jgi:hypothetical protein
MIFASLSRAVMSALIVDLPNVEYQYRKPGDKSGATETRKRRPYESDLGVYHFPQTWGDTSLGFGGVAGQAFTTAYTTVVVHYRDACVYFGGRFAYRVVVDATTPFLTDLGSHGMRSVADSSVYRVGSNTYPGK